MFSRKRSARAVWTAAGVVSWLIIPAAVWAADGGSNGDVPRVALVIRGADGALDGDAASPVSNAPSLPPLEEPQPAATLPSAETAPRVGRYGEPLPSLPGKSNPQQTVSRNTPTPAIAAAPSHESGTDTLPGLPEVPTASAPQGDSTSQPSVNANEPAVEINTAPAPVPTQDEPPQTEEPLHPIPDPQLSGGSTIAPIEAAGFNGVTPGVSTMDDVKAAWGEPRQVAKQNGLEYHLYSIEPFNHVEVTYLNSKVTAIIVRFDRAFPADLVAQHLELTDVRPVLVSNPAGEILGQAFPERGVLFAFAPGDKPGTASMAVTQIILEPISPDTFILRGETTLQDNPEASVADLKQALGMAEGNARAHWLLARALALLNRLNEAQSHVERAVELAPNDPQYRITSGQILSDLHQIDQAIAEVEKAVASAENRLHLKARALCLLGDLYGQKTPPDYRTAVRYHSEAVKLADSLSDDPHPAIRLAAKEALIDAHLGAANDITWGDWEQKEVAVERWLDKARAFAEDFVDNEGGSPEYLLRVASRALASCVGLQGQLDPTPWAELAVEIGPSLVDAASPARKPQLRWELGTALYDAVQTYQLLNQHDQALQYGELAVAYLDTEESRERSASDLYLVGRLYFRLGAIYAIAREDHENAVKWFEKGLPVLEKAQQVGLTDQQSARLGETLVSMGVSYWQVGKAQQALELTQEGIALIETAVDQGILEPSTLGVPYANLATMHRELGQTKEAESAMEKAAARSSDTVQR
ncbi:hypothetical protein JCM19992_28140 [Thermostilla marina]